MNSFKFWIRKMNLQRKHFMIFSQMEHFIKKQTLQAFKLNVRQMKHKKVQNGKALDFHKKKLRSKSIQSWIAYLDIKDDKRRFQNQ